MGERAKRSRSHHDDRDNKHQRRRTERDRERDEKGNDDEVVYRILCPSNVIGSVIGKSGNVINSIRRDSGATVKVVDPFPGSKLRVITIYCYVDDKLDLEVDDEFNDIKPLCPAQDALLKVHAAIENAITSARDSDKRKNSRDRDRGDCQLLVPSSQCSNIIGRLGSTIKKLRQNTRTNINVTAKDASDPSHSCAFDFDNFVAISGDSEAVKKALFAISAIMYKFSPKENIPLESSITEAPPSIIIPSDVPIYTGLYQSMDPIAPERAMPSLMGSSHAANFPSYADAGPTFPVYSSDLPVVSSYGGGSRSRSEDLTIKVLCPSNTLGRVIGKGGGSIKSIRNDSGARVDVVDRKTNDKECVITVRSTETMENVRSSAVEAVLLLQGKMNEEDDDVVTMRLLVPSKVIGCVIGTKGSIINEIRKRTKAEVRISKGDMPKCADDNDELVEVSGEVGSVRDALIQIVLRLRMDVLTDREESRNYSSLSESRYSGGGVSVPMPSVLPTLSSGTGLAYEPRAESGSGLGLLSSSAYGYRHLPVRSLPEDNVYSLSSRSSSLYDRMPAPSALEMVIPAHAVGKVMGKGGMNVENIRKISGASVEVSEPKSSRGDRVALISGTSDQKRTAENLIQAFIMST